MDNNFQNNMEGFNGQTDQLAPIMDTTSTGVYTDQPMVTPEAPVQMEQPAPMMDTTNTGVYTDQPMVTPAAPVQMEQPVPATPISVPSSGNDVVSKAHYYSSGYQPTSNYTTN